MSEAQTPVLRLDLTTNGWVLLAPARARRPQDGPSTVRGGQGRESCPFCPGSEHLTSLETLRVPDPSGKGWSVRVVANKFPALTPDAVPEQPVAGSVFRELGGYGIHEVVIESPDHSRLLADQPLEQIERLLRAIHARFVALMADPRLRAIVVFKNHGETAGTSIAHPHWQIIATPVVPLLLRIKHSVAADYFDRTGGSLYRALLDAELAAGDRVLAVNQEYAAVLPYASATPYQIRILPRFDVASFGHTSEQTFNALAEVLKAALTRLSLRLDDPDFNLILNSAPLANEAEARFGWHMDILPRLESPAGFELGSGMAINPVLPEHAARLLRGQ
jgi:UDPglucose--hexose-1-phosphate uridylyltransferase